MKPGREKEDVLIQRRENDRNVDDATIEGFGAEWQAFDQTRLDPDEYRRLFDSYFGIFPFADLPADAEGFDLGCGSGRWAKGVAERVGRLHCIDPSAKALDVARERLKDLTNVDFHLAAADEIPLPDTSQDFGYSLGVLHHIPDTGQAMRDAVAKLKPGAPFLVYLYYALEFRPAWFRGLWKATDLARRGVYRLPFGARRLVTDGIAALVYWPLARTLLIMEKLGADVSNYPLSSYRRRGFYSMRTDSLDRFGTRLEQRFSRGEIEEMMRSAGLDEIVFSNDWPFWVAVGRKRRTP